MIHELDKEFLKMREMLIAGREMEGAITDAASQGPFGTIFALPLTHADVCVATGAPLASPALQSIDGMSALGRQGDSRWTTHLFSGLG